jgi:hypothetical protein
LEVVVVVDVVEEDVVVAGVEVDFEEELLPPQPATASVLARTARTVKIAESEVRFIGRAPFVFRRLGRPGYQGHLTGR